MKRKQCRSMILGTLTHETEADYKLTGNEAWVTVGGASVWLRRYGPKGVSIEVYKHKHETDIPIRVVEESL